MLETQKRVVTYRFILPHDFPTCDFSSGKQVGSGVKTTFPPPANPFRDSWWWWGNGWETSGGKKVGKSRPHEGQTENVRLALAHMVTDAEATLAGSLGRVSQ
jgi:hypothetical protein